MERLEEEQNCLLQFELTVPMIRIVFQHSPIRIEEPDRVEPNSDVTTRSTWCFHDRVSLSTHPNSNNGNIVIVNVDSGLNILRGKWI